MSLFIERDWMVKRKITYISIHLMLLFITRWKKITIIVLYFNTSHVTVYHKKAIINRLCYSISIHLMLLFINKCRYSCYNNRISIHLMLLFIYHQLQLWCQVHLDFNTSHVTVYRVQQSSEESDSRISIHLMLLFIFIVNRLLFEQFYFNTSHVTVYQIFLFPPRI